MQINNVQQNAAYGVQSCPETKDRRVELVPEENEVPRPKDEYVPSVEDEDIGLYKPYEDGENNSPVEKSETTTCNTDRVDGEIKRLKERQEQLEQKLRSAEGENAERIKEQLESITAELAKKDNDTYRRQNAVFS